MAGATVEIGLATTVKPRERQKDGQVVRRPGVHFCRMAQFATTHGADFVMFEPADVDWRNGTVLGWIPEQRKNVFGNWVKRQCRVPDAIYENVFVHLAVKGYSAPMRHTARIRGVPVFNPPLFNKWQMGEWLSKSDLRQHVPETYRLNDVNAAVHRIRAWGLAYVKPIGGYGGLGVTRIQALPDQQFRISIDRRKGGVHRVRKVMTEDDLKRYLTRVRQVPHLLQKGIRLLTIGGRTVDFRVVVQRDVEGKWQMVGIVPKMASPDGVVTNIIAGGERKTVAQCQTLAKRENKEIPVRELEMVALRIAQRISDARPRTGIVGFDLGVDERGRVYMIEMNPKPARSLLSPDMQKKAAEYGAGFTVYLARQRRRPTHT